MSRLEVASGKIYYSGSDWERDQKALALPIEEGSLILYKNRKNQNCSSDYTSAICFRDQNSEEIMVSVNGEIFPYSQFEQKLEGLDILCDFDRVTKEEREKALEILASVNQQKEIYKNMGQFNKNNHATKGMIPAEIAQAKMALLQTAYYIGKYFSFEEIKKHGIGGTITHEERKNLERVMKVPHGWNNLDFEGHHDDD